MKRNGHGRLMRGFLLPVISLLLISAASAAVIKIIVKPDLSIIASNQSNLSSAPQPQISQISQISSSGNSSASSSGSGNSSASSTSTSTISATSSGDYSYFKDAVFIGDSITAGIKDYNITKNAGIMTANGMSTSNALTSKVSFNSNSMTISSALSSINPAKIYILLGANDITWMTQTTYITNYGKLIDSVKQSGSNATIYIQSIFPVTADYEKSSGITNEKIDSFNNALKILCSDKGVKYVDVASVLKGSDGKLPSSASMSGYNIKVSYYTKWFNFLTTHQ